MPLPTSSIPWPPLTWQPIQRDLDEASAWYAGDEQQIGRFYSGDRDEAPRTITDRILFWRKNTDTSGPDVERFHVPVAADIAVTSADLLFSDTPSITIPEAHTEPGSVDAVACEDYLVQLAEDDGIASTLLEGAELGAALGGVYLRALWDRDLASHPILDVVHSDQAVPEFQMGRLTAVTFWRVVQETPNGQEVWRHLERHERGVILHGLYVGTRRDLGAPVDLAAHSATDGLDVDNDGAIVLPDTVTNFGSGLAVRYVPNVKPNRQRRKHPVGASLGRSDFQGVYSLMDRLDMTWSSWMRDIDLGKSRIIVPNEFLSRQGRGYGATFDTDQRIFSPLEMDPDVAERAGIQFIQPQIRTEDHSAACLELLERIVVTAGYSPQSFGMRGDGSAITATEVDARSSKSDRTTDRKRRYWKREVEDITFVMLLIAVAEFAAPIVPHRPRLDFVDVAENDMRETAASLNLINLAKAASIETRVRMLHPDWDEGQVAGEVARIKEEEGVSVGDPTGQFG